MLKRKAEWFRIGRPADGKALPTVGGRQYAEVADIYAALDELADAGAIEQLKATPASAAAGG